MRATPGGKSERLLIYVDVPYWRDGEGYSTDRAFLKFLIELSSRYDRVVLTGRVRQGRMDYSIPDDIEVVALPDYPTLRHVLAVLGALPRAVGVLWREVGRADAVVAIGPHPLSLPTAFFARVRRKRLVLMVRQNYPEYILHRLPSPLWRPFVLVARAADTVFRIMSRASSTVVVGDELADRYRGAPRLLNLPISLMPAEVHSTHRPVGDEGTIRLLSITRLDPEKSPGLVIEAVARLSARWPDRRVLLTMVGTGELRASLELLASRLAPGQVEFTGYLPHGKQLFDLYRDHDVLVHTALTEGIPQVVVEAQFVGLPVVATDVGGVRGAVGGGASALLVPPGDAEAIATAVARLVEEEALRTRLAESGLAATRDLTLQAQVDQLDRFIASA